MEIRSGGLVGLMTFDPGRLCAVRVIGFGGREMPGRVLSRKANDEASSDGSDVEEDS